MKQGSFPVLKDIPGIVFNTKYQIIACSSCLSPNINASISAHIILLLIRGEYIRVSGKKAWRLSEYIFRDRICLRWPSWLILIHIQDNPFNWCYSWREKTNSQRCGRRQWPTNPEGILLLLAMSPYHVRPQFSHSLKKGIWIMNSLLVLQIKINMILCSCNDSSYPNKDTITSLRQLSVSTWL